MSKAHEAALAVVKAASERFSHDQKYMRDQLIELMSGYSERMTACTWSGDLDRRLYRQGGVWEVMAEKTGWPVDPEGFGNARDFRWVTWQEAGEIYKHDRDDASRLLVELEAHGLNAEGHLIDCGG